MIEVELPDGRIVEFPDGTSRDVMRQALTRLTGAKPAPATSEPAQPERTWRDRIVDNVVGRDDGVESPGERLGEFVRGGTAAVARGIADVPAIPANIAQLATRGVEKLAGMEEPSAVSRGLDALPDTRGLLGAIPVIGPESEYRAPGTAGEYISTAGEFAGGAGLLGGLSAMGRFGVVPGVASEAAGQATEGTAAEPYARTAAALAAPSVLARRLPTGNVPGRDAGRVRAANTLEDAGVTPSAGQATGSDMLRRIEGTAEPTGRQLEDFTSAAMKQIGSKAKDARPENLRAAQSAIVKRMDDLVSGINIRVPQQVTQSIDDIMRRYNRHITAGNKSNALESIADELTALSRNPSQPAPASLLKTWRADIGKLTTSADEATREAAHGFRAIIDDLTDDAMRQAGRTQDIAGLRAARNDYRNYLAVEDAATRAAAEGGIISPTQLNQAIIRTQGRKNYATGRGTDMMDFARAGAEILRPMPTVSAGGVRALDFAPQIAGAGIGAGLLGNPLMGAAAGALVPSVGRAIAKTPAAQNAIKNPTGSVREMAPLVPGLLSAMTAR